MKLQLKYNGHTNLPADAALLRGNDPLIWMQQIDSWQIDPDKLGLYIMPASIQSIEAAGLFVIFKSTPAKNIELLEPYTCVAKRLYIPCNATIFPEVQHRELDELLLCDVQVFHPTIGLAGFVDSNRIRLQDICLYRLPEETDWSFAHPGLPDKPALEKIIITAVSADEVIEGFKQDIGQKPIGNIPVREDEKRTFISKLAGGLKTAFFSVLLSIVNLIDKLLPLTKSSFAKPGSNTDNGKGGVLRKMEKWLTDNLDELQKKRNDEVQRLLNLFEHDTNEALQFAIPLHSPYFNRGNQAASSKLIRNWPTFNLGKLGGGTAIDGWDLGSSYNELRTKYLKAAQQEIARRDFKKAAYVYAHLLGDFHNAANVLEQGKLYREAAALYKDHLKNTTAAAKCLENGGLYLEAIDLYKDLQQEEKVGDLYTLLQQENNALIHFENSIAVKIENNDYLDAARIINEKLVQQERAKQILLQGWESNHNFELCLKKYFDILSGTEETAMVDSLHDIYLHHTATGKKLPLLKVMEQVNRSNSSESLINATQEIAYEIVHDQVEKGDVQSLHMLKNFLPGNKLIGTDTSRYCNNNNLRNAPVIPPLQMQLDNTVEWIETTTHRNQFLVFGIKDDHLHLARINWYGNIEYYFWESTVQLNTRIHSISAPYNNNQIVLHSSGPIQIAGKNLPRNKYFNDALVVNCPVWLNEMKGKLFISAENNIFLLEINTDIMTLHQYRMEGDLLASINCLFVDDTTQLEIEYSGDSYMAFNDGFFYTYSGKNFLIVSADGQSKATNLQTGIRNFCASRYTSEFYIVISTNKGCCLCEPQKGELNFTGVYFSNKLIPLAIDFITAKRFVITERLKATVFEIDGEKPEIIYEAVTTCPVAGVLPGAERNKFAIVEENGKITIHTIP